MRMNNQTLPSSAQKHKPLAALQFCTEIGYQRLNKAGEELCGDHVETVLNKDGAVVVLADGMGSGVKACILSTLTSKIISTMLANNLAVEDAVRTIAATLPVNKELGLAYSTFTVVRISDTYDAEIIQYDNPPAIMLREGKNYACENTTFTVEDKAITRTLVSLRENDAIIMMSDGAVHAGIGKAYNCGWKREDIITFIEGAYNNDMTAKGISSLLIYKCNDLYGGEPGDDVTICSVKLRRRIPVNLLIGPPSNPADVPKMFSLFFSKEGKHIVCGGTTSHIAADFLGKKLETDNPVYNDPDVPPTAKIEGVDLVTEGVITIGKVLELTRKYAENDKLNTDWDFGLDGASQIAHFLLETATDINFYVGKAVNQGQQNPDMPIGFTVKMRIVAELAEQLRKLGKNIKVSYF
jgi:hypothetical protein